MPSDQPPPSVSEFLDRTGAVSVLLEIGMGAKRFSDLEDALSLSSATLTERLQGGETLGLWEKHLYQEEDYPTRYRLTEKGEQVMDEMRELDLPHHIVKMRTYQEEVESRTEQLREWADEQGL